VFLLVFVDLPWRPARQSGYSAGMLIDRTSMAASTTIVAAAGTLLHSHGQWINRLSR
jgi:hypothetical protein